MHHNSDCHDSAIVIVFSAISKYRGQSLQLSIVLIVFVPVYFLLLLSGNTILKHRKDFCFAKMFVKMVPRLIFERAVMLGIFTGSPVFYK